MLSSFVSAITIRTFDQADVKTARTCAAAASPWSGIPLRRLPTEQAVLHALLR